MDSQSILFILDGKRQECSWARDKDIPLTQCVSLFCAELKAALILTQ